MMNKFTKSSQSGFTLIELMVVISIIGVLSSIVLASISTAKLRARDSVVNADLAQMENIMALEYSDNGSYASFQWMLYGAGPWVSSNLDCTIFFNDRLASDSQYKGEMIKLCESVFNAGSTGIYFGQSPTVNDNNRYAIGVRLPSDSSKAKCVGSSGKSLTGASGPWDLAGCWANP